jgi:hypothetical protein
VIAVRLLLEAGVKKVINFYLGATRYALDMGDWTLFDNTGLKGQTAEWARQNLDSDMGGRLLRVESTPAAISEYLPQCSKAIHTVGFSARHIECPSLSKLVHNSKSGIIAPGLFGAGIAFPEETVDPFGNVETSVGLWKFMKYFQRVVPVWLRYGP